MLRVARLAGRAARYAFIAAAACWLLLIAGLALATVIFDPYDERPFDSDPWIAGLEPVRTAMARSAARAIHEDDAASSVSERLGEPDWINDVKTSVFGERFPAATHRTWGYRLNPSWLHGYDDAYLYVHIDANDTVIKAQLGGG